jgi:hypothetical protein
MKKYLILSVGLLAAVYFVFIREYIAYKKVVNERNHLAWDAYYETFPRGWHMEEVRFTQADVARDINSARNFLNFFPDSKHAKQIMAVRDSLWDAEILLYQGRATHAGVDTGGVAFFKKLLLYMKANDKKEIYLQLNKKLALKDYTDYDSLARRICELDPYMDHPVSGNVLPLTKNFQAGDISYLESIVADGISKSFSKVFNPDFVSVIPYHENDNYATAKDLFIKLDYTIQNQEIQLDNGIVIPDLWIISSDKKFECYEIGIGVHFNFSLSIPETQFTYAFLEHAVSLKDIEHAEGNEGIYRKMTANAFAECANSISEKFGIKGAYFKGDKIQ